MRTAKSLKSIVPIATIESIETIASIASIKKPLVAAALLLLGTSGIDAKPRSQQQIASAAAKALSLPATGKAKVARKGTLRKLADRGLLQVMGYEDGGFAIVTTDDLLPEVVGYSEKSYATDNLPEGYAWWLEAMDEAARYYVQNNIQARVVKPNTSKYLPFIRPMLSTEWGQEEPFNNSCPQLFDGEQLSQRCVVGCVGTAIAQILNYYKPTNLKGHGVATLQVPYGDPTGTTIKLDYSEMEFDWQNMRNTYTPGNYTEAEAKAVADLSYAIGVLAVMQYGIDTSGAISDDAVEGLQNYFGLTNVKLYERSDIFGFGDNYSVEQWSDMVYEELNTVGPLYYAAADANDLGGHAFVFDGYNEEGLMHVNWGWHGRFDGYYDLSILDPRIYHFSKAQEIIHGLSPVTTPKGSTQSINVATPGTLNAQAETLKAAGRVGTLNVTGQLNAADLEALAQWNTLTTLNLSEATLEDDALPAKAFYGCSNLRNLLLPKTLRSIGDGALSGLSNLNVLSIPEGDDKDYVIEGDIAYNRDKTEVLQVLPTAPDSVSVLPGATRIHDYAFEANKYIRIVTLPESVELIGKLALAHMPILRELHVASSTPAQVADDTFQGIDPGFAKLFIPAGSREAYENAPVWHELFRSDYVTEVGTMVRARNITRNYGEDVEEYYFEILGERVKGLPEVTCAATKDSPAGEYPIIVSRGTIESDNLVLVNGTLTIVGGPTAISDGGASTGIAAPHARQAAAQGYDLQGRAAGSAHQKGIRIIEGRKVLK